MLTPVSTVCAISVRTALRGTFSYLSILTDTIMLSDSPLAVEEQQQPFVMTTSNTSNGAGSPNEGMISSSISRMRSRISTLLANKSRKLAGMEG